VNDDVREAMPLASAALIVGCGYLGRRVADRLLARGLRVYGTTRSEAGAAALAAFGVQPLIVEVTQAVTLASLRPALAQPQLDVYYLIPPGSSNDTRTTPTDVLTIGLRHALAKITSGSTGGGGSVRRAVMASSTAVYGQQDGARVDADTPAAPHSPRGQLLVDAEATWLHAASSHYVVRLAGLYGPGRVIGRRAVMEGSPVVGRADAPLNLIHVDDAANLLVSVMSSMEAARIELGCDDAPPQRIEYYRYLSGKLGVLEPQVLSDDEAVSLLGIRRDRLRSVSAKRCDNQVTVDRTGWRPRYANYFAGLESILSPDTAS